MPGRIRPGLRTSMRTFAVRMIGIENGTNVADDPGEDSVGIGIQTNVGLFPDAHIGEIIFVDIAQESRRKSDRRS